MFGKILALCIFLLSTPLALSQSCGSCMSNFVACINETSYQLCNNGTIIDTIYNCPANQVCTSSKNVCESDTDGTTSVSVCGGTTAAGSTGCSSCTGKTSGSLICLSSTQFAICTGSGASMSPSNPLQCSSGYICSEDLFPIMKQVCAPQAIADFFKAEETCPNTGEVTASTRSTEATTALPPADITGLCEDANETTSYFQLPNPADCRAYIYCERNSYGGFLSLDMRCRSGEVYSATQKKCITGSRCVNESN